MPREISNVGASARARLLDRARTGQLDFQGLLTRYALERLLYRLSVSAYRDHFILKGAMLFTNWGLDPFRLTRDLDLLGGGDSNIESLAETFRAICATPVADDGVVFDVVGLRTALIRKEVEHGGVRVRTTATIDGARVSIQIDVGFGDVVTPAAVEILHLTLLDAPPPRLWAYPAETVVAEKFETLVRFGIANSRLQDFHDLWWIAWGFEFRRSGLSEAIRRTFARRDTALPTNQPAGLSDEFAANHAARWRSSRERERKAGTPKDFGDVIADLRTFLLPLLTHEGEDRTWPPRGPWSPSAQSIGADKR